MNRQKALDQRIRRTSVLFKELGFRIEDAERTEEAYTSAFTNNRGTEGSLFIDQESSFLELGYSFSFSPVVASYLKTRIEKVLRICYEYGCYLSIHRGKTDISLSIFSKIYFAGLNYQCLKETLRDFRLCVEVLTELLEMKNHDAAEEIN